MSDELDTDIEQEESLQEEYVEPNFEEPYKPVNQLYVPEEAKEKFKELGFDLQWVRIYAPNSNGALDSKHIQRKEADFYEFVKRKEIPGLKDAMTSFFGEELNQNSHGLYIVGDLALAKFPLKRKEQKKRYNQAKVRSRTKAVIHDLRKNAVMPDKTAGEKIETVREQPGQRDVEFGK